MNNKNLKLIIAIAIFYCLNSYSQVIGGIGGSSDGFQITLTPRDKEDMSEEFNSIAHKMYLNQAFASCMVDELKDPIFLRYNMYKDEMEFKKGDKIFYLKKQKDRKVKFKYTNNDYRVYKHENELKYFEVHVNDKNMLLSRKIVNFIQAKPAATSYQRDKPADFKREDDKIFLRYEDGSIVEIPSKKKNFYQVFKDKSKDVKSFVKSNKLSIKKLQDIKQIVTFYNSL